MKSIRISSTSKSRLPGFQPGRSPFSDTLLIGWGNPDRQDEGVAWHMILELARYLNRTIPVEPREGFYSYGQLADIIYSQQLVPGIAERLFSYQRVCFINSHHEETQEGIIWTPISPISYSAFDLQSATPSVCLAMTHHLFGRVPAAMQLSVRGYSFDFTRSLSDQTEVLVKQATRQLLEWLGARKTSL